MPRSRLPIPWTHVALYAALLAAGTVLLQWLDYQRLVRSNAGLVYDGLLATGFLALGIWLGVRLLAKRPPLAEGEGNPEAQAALGISARELRKRGQSRVSWCGVRAGRAGSARNLL